MILRTKSKLKKDSILTYKVVKANKLIESKSDFTAMQHKIILFAISQIKPKDTELRTYTIKASDITKSKNYEMIKKSITNLEKTTIGINEEGEWIDYPFVENISFVKDRSCAIKISFSKKVEKFLLGLKAKYTSYTLENAINFKHNYSLRLYELCKQHQSIGHREIKLDNLRTMFNLDNKYSNFANFRIKVLEQALTEINKYSDIFIELSENIFLEHNKVTIIKFIIKKNKAMLMLEQIKYLILPKG